MRTQAMRMRMRACLRVARPVQCVRSCCGLREEVWTQHHPHHSHHSTTYMHHIHVLGYSPSFQGPLPPIITRLQSSFGGEAVATEEETIEEEHAKRSIYEFWRPVWSTHLILSPNSLRSSSPLLFSSLLSLPSPLLSSPSTLLPLHSPLLPLLSPHSRADCPGDGIGRVHA